MKSKKQQQPKKPKKPHHVQVKRFFLLFDLVCYWSSLYCIFFISLIEFFSSRIYFWFFLMITVSFLNLSSDHKLFSNFIELFLYLLSYLAEFP